MAFWKGSWKMKLNLSVVSVNGPVSVCVCPVIPKIAQGFSRDSGISRCEYTWQ